MLRVLAILMGIIQFSFAFHAMKTGNGPMWITIILVFPVVGCIAYYFMEVFPGTRERLRTTYVGFEAKCRYGELPMRPGRTAEAREPFTVIVQNARRSALETEQEWMKLARRGLETGAA